MTIDECLEKAQEFFIRAAPAGVSYEAARKLTAIGNGYLRMAEILIVRDNPTRPVSFGKDN